MHDNVKPNREELPSTPKDWVTIQEFHRLFPKYPIGLLKKHLADHQESGLQPHVQIINDRLHISVTGYVFWIVEVLSNVFTPKEERPHLHIVEEGEN